MEYIEEKPVEGKKLSRKTKIILAASIVTAVTAVIGVTYGILIDKVFLNYDNIELYHFSYDSDDPNHEVTIDSIVSSKGVPTILKIPSKLNGYPVTKIGDKAFAHVKNVEQIIFPETVKSIGKEAFLNCSNLATLNFPDGLTSVGTDAFAGTKWLSNQANGEVMAGKFLYTYNGTLPEDSIIVKSEDSPEYGKHTGKTINLGNYSDLSDGVFKSQENLVYVEIPDTFKEVHTELFAGCTGLEKVVLPDHIEAIGDSAFSGCYELRDINLPDSIKTIGSYALSNTNIQGSLVLPAMLDNVGEYAFSNNIGITSVTFPAHRADGGIEGVVTGMFSNCGELRTVNFPAEEFDPLKSHLSTIGANAFEMTKITDMVIPYNVQTVEAGAFYMCTELTKVEVYNNLTNTGMIVRSVDDDGSYYWAGISSIRQGVLRFDKEVFHNAVSFKGLVLVDKDGNKTSENVVSLPVTLKSLGPRNDNSYLFANTAVETINLVKDLTGAVNTSELGDIAYVAPYLCYDDAALTTVIVKENANLKEIKANAFENCVSLTSIDLPDGLETVGARAFAGCTSLADIDLSKAVMNGIAESLFEGCTTLTSYDVNKEVATIQKAAFKNAIALERVTFPTASVLSAIMENAFEGCTSLSDINLPDTIATINKEAFKGCTSLESIAFGTRLSTLRDGVFKNTGLKSIVLPKGIKALPVSLFEGSEHLVSLTLAYEDAVVTLGNNALLGTGISESTGNIYVPEALVDAYKLDAKWSLYSERIQAIPAE